MDPVNCDFSGNPAYCISFIFDAVDKLVERWNSGGGCHLDHRAVHEGFLTPSITFGVYMPKIPSIRSSVYRLSQGCWFASGRDVMSPLPHAVGGSSSVLRMGVDPEDLSDKRLFMEFNLFGFSGRTCQLELNANGDCVFSKGMVSKEPGAWRIEDEEGQEYLQFTCPLTELYSELFDIPSALLFARIPVRKGADGDFILEGGQIISERSSLLGLKKDPIDEGKFSARVMQEDEVFPETPIDFASVEIPVRGVLECFKRCLDLQGWFYEAELHHRKFQALCLLLVLDVVSLGKGRGFFSPSKDTIGLPLPLVRPVHIALLFSCVA
ncbi:unnamed protein product [Discosporangium mesarthrocarpum]